VCMISRGGAALLFNYLANMILGVVVPIRDRSCSFIKSSIVSLSGVPSQEMQHGNLTAAAAAERDVHKDAHTSLYARRA
jgi:hypothetical protein